MTAIVLLGGAHPHRKIMGNETPIAMAKVSGAPFLYWITHWLKQQGHAHIVFSIGMNNLSIKTWIQDMCAQEKDISFDVVIENKPLGTAGASALCAKRYKDEYYTIVNGDALIPTNLSDAIATLKTHPEMSGLLVGVLFPNAGRYGALALTPAQDHLLGFHEKTSGMDLVNCGVYVLRRSVLEDIVCDKCVSFEHDCFPRWLQAGKQFLVHKAHVPFLHIDTDEAHAETETYLQEHRTLFIDTTLEPV